MTSRRANQPVAKGLWRREYGDTSGSLRGVFRNLSAHPDQFATIIDPAQGLYTARVDLRPNEGQGHFRFISIRDQILCGMSDCVLCEDCHEEVFDEGLIELHFQIEGPVRLSWDIEENSTPPAKDNYHPVHEATLVALRCAPDLAYTVRFPPGSYRLMGLYVTPEMLRGTLGVTHRVIEQFVNPPQSEISIVERKINLDFLRALQELWDIPFENTRDLMRASAKLTEIMCLVADSLDEGGEEGVQSFSQRDLEMFERARETLATDFSKTYSTTALAKELGTNATKLKAGFKLFFGTTIFEYRKKYRMDYALTLLGQGDLTIAEIAELAGYKRQASFTSAFKLHFGVLPSTAKQSAATTSGSGRGVKELTRP